MNLETHYYSTMKYHTSAKVLISTLSSPIRIHIFKYYKTECKKVCLYDKNRYDRTLNVKERIKNYQQFHFLVATVENMY